MDLPSPSRGNLRAQTSPSTFAPCYVFSPIMEQLTAEKRGELLEMIPVKRFCKPEEVAHAVMFLVSPLWVHHG